MCIVPLKYISEVACLNDPNKVPSPQSPHLVVEEANSDDVLSVHSVRHGEVSQRVPQQQHVGALPQLQEVFRVEEGTLPLVEGVNQLALEGLQYSLEKNQGQEGPSLGKKIP